MECRERPGLVPGRHDRELARGHRALGAGSARVAPEPGVEPPVRLFHLRGLSAHRLAEPAWHVPGNAQRGADLAPRPGGGAPVDQAAGRHVRGMGTAGVKPWYDGGVEVPTMAHETILLHGHIVDSLLLPKVLDLVLPYGGAFEPSPLPIWNTPPEPPHPPTIRPAASPEQPAPTLPPGQPRGAAHHQENGC